MTDATAPRIAVTGVTGNIGGAVARQLAELGISQRMIARNPSRAPHLPGAQVVPAGFDDRAAVREALRDIDIVLMVSAGESEHRVDVHRSFVEAAADAGVAQIVYTSFLGASPTATFTLGRDHAATEAAIAATGMRHTLLRDNFYADFFVSMAADDGVIRGPAGDGRVSAVAIRDVADAAAAVLLDPQAHAEGAYDLTGPEALTLEAIARTVAAATGRETSYQQETLAQAYESRADHEAPDWQVAAWVSTYTSIAAGSVAAISGDVERLTGHPATSLTQLLHRRLP